MMPKLFRQIAIVQWVMRNQYRKEMTMVMIIKIIALLLLWWICIPH